MKKVINGKITEQVLSMVNGITYKTFPYWYGETVRELKLDLVIPKHRAEGTSLPVIVWVCGGAFSQMDRSLWLPNLVEFAKAGFAIAAVDYRVGPVNPHPAAVEDVRAAVRYLRAHASLYGLDPNRMVSMGESAGGYLACMAALGGTEYDVGEYTDQSGTVQAVVNFYGKVDFTSEGQDPICNSQVNNEFLDGNTDQDYIRSICPKYLVTESSAPMLIFHGSNDPLVPIRESLDLYESLCGHGVRSDLYVLDGIGHGEDEFYQPEIKDIIIRFLREVL